MKKTVARLLIVILCVGLLCSLTACNSTEGTY